MNCANHPLVESVAFCGSCGRALCQECKRDVRGTIYCENCLATRMQNSPLPPALGASGGPSPGVALVLGFIPGVGAAYCGQILKGLVEVLIFISLMQLADRVEVFGWLVAAFWIYMVIDSYHTARRKQLGLPSEEWFGLGNKKVNARCGPGCSSVSAYCFYSTTWESLFFTTFQGSGPCSLSRSGLSYSRDV